jgi:phage anti-repressor protein
MKNRIKLNLFENINDKEIAYILGLLWADGHVTFANNNAKTPIIKHSANDLDNIVFKEILKFSGEWNTFTSKNIGSYAKTPKTISVNWISSRKFGEFLIKNQYRDKNKSPELILNEISDKLKPYWFRGFFDGDGSVTIKNKGHHSIAFTGNEKQDWKFIIDLFKEIKIFNYKIRIIESRGGKSSQIRITNKKELKIFENYIYGDYDNNPLGLYRKRNQFKCL